MTKKELWLRDYMSSKGLDYEQIDKYMDLIDRCHPETMYREWRKQAPEEEKNRDMETHFRKENSPNKDVSRCHEIAHERRMESECNLSIF